MRDQDAGLDPTITHQSPKDDKREEVYISSMNFRYEKCRLASFSVFTDKFIVTYKIWTQAEHGIFYTGKDYQGRCYFCNKSSDVRQDPLQSHDRSCAVLTRNNEDNIPLDSVCRKLLSAQMENYRNVTSANQNHDGMYDPLQTSDFRSYDRDAMNCGSNTALAQEPQQPAFVGHRLVRPRILQAVVSDVDGFVDQSENEPAAERQSMSQASESRSSLARQQTVNGNAGQPIHIDQLSDTGMRPLPEDNVELNDENRSYPRMQSPRQRVRVAPQLPPVSEEDLVQSQESTQREIHGEIRRRSGFLREVGNNMDPPRRHRRHHSSASRAFSVIILNRDYQIIEEQKPRIKKRRRHSYS